MKKFATLMLALAMLISCAAIGMAEDITLDVIICQYGPKTNDWFTGTGMNGTSFVKKFEEANPGIKLNLEVVSWNDVYTVVSTRISNNNAPDILNLDSFADYANEGLLMPVKDYCPEVLYNDFFPSFIEQSVIDGTVWAVPDLASARALYYNVDLLEAAGVEVPTTWAELEDVCQALVDFYGGDVYPWGIDMTTDEGQATAAASSMTRATGRSIPTRTSKRSSLRLISTRRATPTRTRRPRPVMTFRTCSARASWRWSSPRIPCRLTLPTRVTPT